MYKRTVRIAFPPQCNGRKQVIVTAAATDATTCGNGISNVRVTLGLLPWLFNNELETLAQFYIYKLYSISFPFSGLFLPQFSLDYLFCSLPHLLPQLPFVTLRTKVPALRLNHRPQIAHLTVVMLTFKIYVLQRKNDNPSLG